MKILMVSMFANHFFNWVNQLENSGHEVYWIDVFDNGAKVESIGWVHQTVNWRRKLDFTGRQGLKRFFPGIYKMVQSVNEKELSEIVDEKIKEIKPDVVQSFVLFSACAPILGVMNKYPDLKWIYSAWGNDLFYFQNQANYLKDIKAVLPRVNYMFADCSRDFEIAKKYGFRGEFLGVYPGGGGFEFNFEDNIYPVKKRKIILIKGYQKLFGESISVLKAIQESESELKDYEIVVFGADGKCLEYIEGSGMETKPNFKVQQNIGRGDVMKLMGQSLIYIGNSISDGMPNTMLEAMIMGAFPIQSNPGGATEELLTHGKNGFLITNPLNVEEIKTLILEAIGDKNFLEKAVMHNFKMIKPILERNYVKNRVLKKYTFIEQSIGN
jgi:glycosyltransferase involved in cell wall biosynthesis